MDRLASEWLRLYAASADDAAALVDAQGRVRCMVLSLGRPADWPLLKGVWQSVQTELHLPAPGIAVSGTDSYQLWFSLAEPVPAVQARAFLTALCERLLGDVPARRLQLWPEVHAGVDVDAAANTAKATPTVRHAAPIPAPTAHPAQWSAFVAPDLAPVFADTPWLDIPPNAEGQAELLARLSPIAPHPWREAVAHWPTAAPTLNPAAASPQAPEAETVRTEPMPLPLPLPAHDAALNAPGLGPRAFLQHVMHDPSVALALRIDAAKALLAHEALPPSTTPPCP